jgi:hypothetical protein
MEARHWHKLSFGSAVQSEAGVLLSQRGIGRRVIVTPALIVLLVAPD